MIDHPDQVERLMERLSAALPIPARVTPEVQMTLQQQRGVAMPANCSVTWISYAGDEGGIVCRVEAAAETAEAVFASITHLRFDPRLPLAREIVSYQKHRVKRLRRQPSPG
jgi:hypothetical protein